MKKACCYLLVTACIFLIAGCGTTTYKNEEALKTMFLENEKAFVKVAETIEQIDELYENSGYIHKQLKNEPDNYAPNWEYTLVEQGELHIHSKNPVSATEFTIIAETVNELFTKVDINSISFADNQLRFNIYDAANKYSYYPTIIYCLDSDIDESVLERYYGSFEIFHWKDRWYACFVEH